MSVDSNHREQLMKLPSENRWILDERCASLNALKRSFMGSGVKFVDLAMINPDIPPPRELVDRLGEAAIRSENHRYAVARGIRRLREGFVEKYQQAFDVLLDPEKECCVTMGSKDATFHLLHLLKRPNTRVLLAAPTYPIHRSAARLSECQVDSFEISRDQEKTVERIERKLTVGEPTVLLLNFPNNPTGVTVSSEFWSAIRSLRSRYDLVIINDFTYGEMGFHSQPSSLLTGADKLDGLLEIYSMSKAYSVPGWRVGAVLGDGRVVELLSRLKSQLDYGNFLPIQIAASFGLQYRENDLVAPIREEYRRRCKTVLSGLAADGWSVSSPSAGASVWARIPERLAHLGSEEFCRLLLSNLGVCALPGKVFGGSYDQFVRFALVAPEPQLGEVLQRLPLALKEGESRKDALQATGQRATAAVVHPDTVSIDRRIS